MLPGEGGVLWGCDIISRWHTGLSPQSLWSLPQRLVEIPRVWLPGGHFFLPHLNSSGVGNLGWRLVIFHPGCVNGKPTQIGLHYNFLIVLLYVSNTLQFSVYSYHHNIEMNSHLFHFLPNTFWQLHHRLPHKDPTIGCFFKKVMANIKLKISLEGGISYMIY